MRKLFTVLILVVLSIRIFSQDIVFEKDITLRSVFKDKRESLPIVNNDKQEIILFLIDNAEIKGLRFNMNYELTDDFVAEKPINKFNVLLGHSINNEEYHLFFTNEKKNKIYVKTISISNKKSISKQIPLKLKNERFLETISYNNKFYLLSILKWTSKIKIYVFEGNSIARTEVLDFSEYKFSSTGFTNLYDVLLSENNSPLQFSIKIHKIDNSNPNPLDLTTKENKIYYYNDRIFLTLDNNLENTKVITISLKDYSSKVEFYNQINIECGDSYRIKSNSYLFLDNLYQIKGCKKELCFQIIDMENNSTIKEYRVKENEEISFRNTPLIQEGGTGIFAQGSEKELNKTKQVLRKISASDIGITTRLSENNIELTIGGFKEIKQSSVGGVMTTSPGPNLSTPYGTISTPPTYHYNPTMYGYSTYTRTRAVYFKTLLDKTSFNHVSGELSNNAYDKIKDYEEDNDEGMSSETIFKVDNYYVFGYYKKWDKKYYLVKFE